MAHLCEACGGSGAAEVHDDGSYTRCWSCNGNGLDPAAYFRWGTHPPLQSSPGYPGEPPEGMSWSDWYAFNNID